MKKMTITALICALMFCVVCAGCNNAAGTKKPSTGGNNETDNTQKFVPDDIQDRTLSDLPAEQKAEIEKLYGCYWMDGAKDNCIKIGADGLYSYSTAMSFSYMNVRWAQVSDSWVCFSYHSNDFDYAPDSRKVILKFIKDSGSIKLWQYVVPMSQKSGPFTNGREVEEIEVEEVEKESGKTVKRKYYVYDKADSSSPKMHAPTPR